MGLDLVSVPVRLDSAPVRALREDADVWEEATPHPPFSLSDYGPRPAVDRELPALLPEGFDLGWDVETRGHERAE